MWTKNIDTYNQKFMETISQQYDETKAKLKAILEKQKYVCCTCDVWSSRAQAYLGVTVHYISTEFERKSFVLAFRQLKGRQTYDVLGKILDAIFKEYGLSTEKITNVVTDGGSAFCKSFKVYGVRRDDDEKPDEGSDKENDDEMDQQIQFMPFMQNNGDFFSSNMLDFENTTSNEENQSIIQCEDSSDDEEDIEIVEIQMQIAEIVLPPQRRYQSHNVNVVSKDFEKEISGPTKTALISSISKLHTLWVLTKRSSAIKTKCVKILGCTFMLPCATRWNSKYDAINKSCQADIKPKVNLLIQKLRKEFKTVRNLQNITTSDWNNLHDYLKVMQPVANALDKLQGEKNCGQGYILPTFVAMKHRISLLTGRQTLIDMMLCMLKVIDARFASFFRYDLENREFIIAALSNPRFKMSFIENSYNQQIAQNYLIEACTRLSNNPTISNGDDDGPVNDAENDGFFVSFDYNSCRRNSFENSIEAEVIRYLIEERKSDEILNEYPSERNVYFRYNTTLASYGAVERAFSQSLMIFAPRRNRLSASNFEKTLLIKHNRQLLEKYIKI